MDESVDLPAFATAIRTLSEAFHTYISPAQVNTYLQALRDLPIEDIQRAVGDANKNLLPPLPVPSQIRRLALNAGYDGQGPLPPKPARPALPAPGEECGATSWAQILRETIAKYPDMRAGLRGPFEEIIAYHEKGERPPDDVLKRAGPLGEVIRNMENAAANSEKPAPEKPAEPDEPEKWWQK